MPEKTIEPFAAIQSAHLLSRGQEDPRFQAVQDFLQRFGYLRAGTFRENQLDEATAEALARYQQWQGLAPTGTFDEQTREQMTTHRCGMPDLDSGVAFSTRCSWPHPNLTFALAKVPISICRPKSSLVHQSRVTPTFLQSGGHYPTIAILSAAPAPT